MNGIKTILYRTDLIFTSFASKQLLKNFRWLFFTVQLVHLSKVLSCMFSLFNLQGTHPFKPVFDFLGSAIAEFHFNTRFSVCQELF